MAATLDDVLDDLFRAIHSGYVVNANRSEVPGVVVWHSNKLTSVGFLCGTISAAVVDCVRRSRSLP